MDSVLVDVNVLCIPALFTPFPDDRTARTVCLPLIPGDVLSSKFSNPPRERLGFLIVGGDD